MAKAKVEQSSKKRFTDAAVLSHLKKKYGKSFESLKLLKPGIIYAKLASADNLIEVCRFLKKNLSFKYPLSISALDWPENYELVYHISSYENNNLVELHLDVPKDKPEVMSVVRVWKGANSHEREAYDMIGINFISHPDLRRILLPEDSDFHPLRKDFPLGGDKETGGARRPKGAK